MDVSDGDRKILRDLARRVAEIAHRPVQPQKAAMWRKHNALQRVRPMVLIFPEGSWRELITPADLLARDEWSRRIELGLRRRLYAWEHLRDDNTVEPTFPCGLVTRSTGWGIDVRTTDPQQPTGAKHYEAALATDADPRTIHLPQITLDREASRRQFERVADLLGDILDVEQRGRTGFGIAPLDLLGSWRGYEQLLYDLVERPDWVHAVLDRIMDGYLAELDSWIAQDALSLNNREHYVGSGGVGYTDELPQPDFDGQHVRPRDLWGFATAQIFSEVSPAMHEEFALRHERRWLERFGLNCYGCCEPLHRKLDAVKRLPDLRRVSMSPWVDVAAGAQQLEDRYIFSYKPNPAVVAAETWQPDRVRRDLRAFCERTRGCIVEIIMKDIHTCRHQPRRMGEWTRIALEVAEEFA